MSEIGPDGKEWAKTEAGYKHVESVMDDAVQGSSGLVWFGHAVREAFVAGAEWQERRAGEGWQTVPKEPTNEMIDAHFAAHARAKTVFADVPDIWRAMLAAAPPPPGSEPSSALAEAMEVRRRTIEECATIAKYEALNLLDNDPSDEGKAYGRGYANACKNAVAAIHALAHSKGE